MRPANSGERRGSRPTNKRTSKNYRNHLADIVDERLNVDLSFFILPRSYAYLVEKEDHSLPAVLKIAPSVLRKFSAPVNSDK